MEHTFTDTSIRFYRKLGSYRQFELAEKLGITYTDMSFIENKKIYPKLELAERLAEALNIPIGKIYSEQELNLILYENKK